MSNCAHDVRRLELNQTLKTLLTASFFTLMASVGTNSMAAELKIGYVQVDKILQEAPQTAESGKKLEREFSPRSQELERTQKQIRDIETTLDKESVTLSESDRRNKERDVSNLKIEFQRKQRELREDINLRKNEELSVLQDRINKAVQTVSETDGYDLVVYGGVAYASKKIDITDKVLKLLGKK
ncbi:OmpH family outer membrane protein [Methylotenera versatilis]|uniref:OmpH family outer membrane protein n=1 Tax=Methylotenera versatilis TaxID=1055487 RepID=UPI000646A800|nr:OmpH family outer membrane protein [Methylotenera versatilis]